VNNNAKNNRPLTKTEAEQFWNYVLDPKNKKRMARLFPHVNMEKLANIPNELAVTTIMEESQSIQRNPMDAVRYRCIDRRSNIDASAMAGYPSPNGGQSAIQRTTKRIVSAVMSAGDKYLCLSQDDSIEYLCVPGENRLKKNGINTIGDLQILTSEGGWYDTIRGFGVRRATAIRRKMIKLGLNITKLPVRKKNLQNEPGLC
jgi:hypothetical protein